MVKMCVINFTITSTFSRRCEGLTHTIIVVHNTMIIVHQTCTITCTVKGYITQSQRGASPGTHVPAMAC